MTQTANATQSARKPSFIAWHVVEGGEDRKSFWTRIGAAWNHRDGKGITLELDLIPVGAGKITLRVPEEKKAEAGA